jgi:hypothetical protein
VYLKHVKNTDKWGVRMAKTHDENMFEKVQLAQKSEYIGGPRQPRGVKDENYNNGGDTDKSPGAGGRTV